MKLRFVFFASRRLYALCALIGLLAVAGCSVPAVRTGAGNPPPGADSLADFIIGKWVSKEAVGSSGKPSRYTFEIEFTTDSFVKLAVLNEASEFLDGFTAPFQFVDTNTLFVNNQRAAGGEKWLLEREGAGLRIQRIIGPSSLTLWLVRLPSN